MSLRNKPDVLIIDAPSPSASQELASQFESLLRSDSDFGLLATISNETLTPTKTLGPSTSSDFASNLDLLAPHLQPNEALYIILRRYPTAPRFVAVTYVPDSAPVRQKMLFAATRLTLVRELGSEHFRETIFATTAAELTAAGFERHDAHAKLEAPLTEEEESLGEVRRAEMEAGQGSGRREIHLSKSLAMPVGEDALAALGEVGKGGRTLVMLASSLPTTFTFTPFSPYPSIPPEREKPATCGGTKYANEGRDW